VKRDADVPPFSKSWGTIKARKINTEYRFKGGMEQAKSFKLNKIIVIK
jgi:hypothetical protein